jgi:hypothetical protein
MRINGKDCIVLNMQICHVHEARALHALRSTFGICGLSIRVGEAAPECLIVDINPLARPERRNLARDAMIADIYGILLSKYWEDFCLRLLDLVQTGGAVGTALCELVATSGVTEDGPLFKDERYDPETDRPMPLLQEVSRRNIIYLVIGAIAWAIQNASILTPTGNTDHLIYKVKNLVAEYTRILKGDT